jgi:hypothetical protein
MQRNEDLKALPKEGQTLDDLQRHGTGDRHVILVDPVNGLLHEFWQGRKTDAGWEASAEASFNLRTGALRPERWTVATPRPAHLPAWSRYDECERGMVEHACASPRARRAGPSCCRPRTGPARTTAASCRAWASASGSARTST